MEGPQRGSTGPWLCVGAVTDPKKRKCPPWARCERKSFYYDKYVCRCVGVKRGPVTDPKTGILKACPVMGASCTVLVVFECAVYLPGRPQ